MSRIAITERANVKVARPIQLHPIDVIGGHLHKAMGIVHLAHQAAHHSGDGCMEAAMWAAHDELAAVESALEGM
jgi:hypothetical protein